jgi:Fe-S cluster biogenesis protein NfuA
VIRPLPVPRFTRRARQALAGFVETWEGTVPAALVVELDPPPTKGGRVPSARPPDVALRLVPATEPASPDQVERADRPVTVRFRAEVGEALEGLVIDFLDEEGGVRGFLVRTAGPSGSRAPGPPSSPPPPPPAAEPGPLVQIRPRAASPTPADPAGSSRGSHPVEDRVRAEIQGRVNPLVACHGGEVELVRLRDDGVAEVAMRGGCQGCAAAASTLHDVVSRILLRAVPDLSGVLDVTAHDEGTNPFLARD